MKNNQLKHVLLLGRVFYIGLALLWLVLNKNNYLLSVWDAQRIHVPMTLYLTLPSLVLILYAALPTKATWTSVITTFTLGWGIHVYESLSFNMANMGVKADALSTVIQLVQFIFLFAVCGLLLYTFGPYIRKKYKDKNEELTNCSTGPANSAGL